jgi:hypothetical protein
MHTRTLDFGTVLKDRLRPPDRPIALYLYRMITLEKEKLGLT